MPFYVSPEQLMKDRADFARKGIARGRSVIVVQYADGILFVAENPSEALHKISEIYDRIAFAAVGRYNEFENLRIAGVRLADLRGYSYDRRDVTGRGLANAYAQTLGTIFSSGGEKPYEVEIFVAEVGDTPHDDQIYRLTYDGSVADEQHYAVMGGAAEPAVTYLAEHHRDDADLATALRAAVAAMGQDAEGGRTISAAQIEAATLERSRSQQRKFRRLSDATVAAALPAADASGVEPGGADASGVEPASEASKVEPAADPSGVEPGGAAPGGALGDAVSPRPDDPTGSTPSGEGSGSAPPE
ncbi:MAG: proteasome subunit alpha [Nocardioidaceae bacterium]